MFQPVEGAVDAIADAGMYPGIRMFTVPRVSSKTPLDDCDAAWQTATPASVGQFSAVGYFFGRMLYKALGIPVGLITSNWGGSTIEAWMTVEAIDATPGIDHAVAKSGTYDNSIPQRLYNGMILPVCRYTAKGFIWYQGESNKGYHAKYPYDMAALAANWRAAWGGGEQMPFYYVQLAPFDYDIPMHRFRGEENPILLPLMVEAQIRALDLIPNTGMAVNTDLGDATQIHPPRKDLVGQRLALLALTGTYGCEGIDSRGPLFERADFGDGRAVVTFRSNSTLIPTDTPLQGFEIAGKDRIFHPAEAFVIHRDYDFSRQVEVRSDAVAEPVAVRYAFRNVVERVNLTNTIGLPAFPFRTDTWDDAGFAQ